MTGTIRYPCGCVNATHAPSGVLRSVAKCKGHRKERRSPEFLGAAYYEEIGAIVDGVPQCPRYAEELTDALGRGPVAPHRGCIALEVGCGASMYAALLINAGYVYVGLEPSSWASRWTRQTYLCEVVESTLEDFDAFPGMCDVVFAMHCLEHVDDAPAALARCAGCLKRGGELWLIVPDDSDPVNPDHEWFFTEATLRGCIEAAGLAVVKVAVRKRIERENFIYCRARKP